MEFSEYQQQLKILEEERGWDRVLPSHTFMHMGEELGEIARVLECLEGYRGSELDDEELHTELSGELADLMNFIFKLANRYGIDIDRAMRASMHKFLTRYGDIEQSREEMSRYISYQEKKLEQIRGKREETI